eukprot:466346-Rhodomonas_salina.3
MQAGEGREAHERTVSRSTSGGKGEDDLSAEDEKQESTRRQHGRGHGREEAISKDNKARTTRPGQHGARACAVCVQEGRADRGAAADVLAHLRDPRRHLRRSLHPPTSQYPSQSRASRRRKCAPADSEE